MICSESREQVEEKKATKVSRTRIAWMSRTRVEREMNKQVWRKASDEVH